MRHAGPSVDRSYARAFNAVFPAVARAHHVAFYPFLLEGVALNPRLNLPDRIHANARSIKVIARRLAPTAAAALGATRTYRSWLSLLPRRLMAEWTTSRSRPDWH